MSTEAEESPQEVNSIQDPETLAQLNTEQPVDQQMDSKATDTAQPSEKEGEPAPASTTDGSTEREKLPEQQEQQQETDPTEQNVREPNNDRNKTPPEPVTADEESESQTASAITESKETGTTEKDSESQAHDQNSAPEQGEMSDDKKKPKESEDTVTDTTKHSGVDTDSSSQKALETEQGETTTSTGEATDQDQQESTDNDTKQTESSRPGTDQSSTKSKDTDKKGKKDKKKEKKREKKKSRQASRDDIPTSAAPATTGGVNHLEPILLSYFLTADLENSGHIDSEPFWEIIQSFELNLQLNSKELVALQGLVQQDQSGMINYTEFSSQAAVLISTVYHDQPDSDHHWVLVSAKDKSTIASYNKKTGETRETVAEEVDLFGEYIESLFQGADQEGKGYMTREEFDNLLQSEQISPSLTDEDILQMQQYFDENIPETGATFTDFYPLGKGLILGIYRARDTTGAEWLQLNSAQGVVWLNKFTGETRRDAADERQQEIAFLNQAYAEVEAVNFELEQYKQQNRELQNELAQAAEEQETLATQLYETGHHLDEANAEIEARTRELDEVREIIRSKDQEIEQVMAQRGEYDSLRQKLEDTENELRMARDTIAVRDQTVAERDSNISELQRTSDAITDKLKTAHGQMDARDSTISNLKHKLNFKQMEADKYEKQSGELDGKLSTIEQDLKATKQALEEKTSALIQARKHLKNSRERTMELEKDSEKLAQTQEKLRSAECEIRTLKSFLTTKTAMIEKNKKELRETKAKVTELQEKDRRRAIILADVLEKTARQFQQQAGTFPTKQLYPDPFQTPTETRPASAPAIPPEDDETDGPEVTQIPSPRVIRTYTVSKGATTVPHCGVNTESPPHKKTGRAKPRGRSKTVPKLPPIHKAGQAQKHTSFVFPTQNEIRREHWEKDQQVMDHADSNPHCTCELCRMNATIVGRSTLRPETEATTQTGLSGFQVDADPKEMAMARQLRKGQRVVIKMKKSEYDLEPQQLTGLVKYIGKIDSEYIDNRIYVGVKLDEPAGDTDGLIKGKRYFTCPSKHGKIVRISSVVAVLPNKSVFYKPLQGISKRSPYGGAAPKKSNTESIKVT